MGEWVLCMGVVVSVVLWTPIRELACQISLAPGTIHSTGILSALWALLHALWAQCGPETALLFESLAHVHRGPARGNLPIARPFASIPDLAY